MSIKKFKLLFSPLLTFILLLLINVAAFAQTGKVAGKIANSKG